MNDDEDLPAWVQDLATQENHDTWIRGVALEPDDAALRTRVFGWVRRHADAVKPGDWFPVLEEHFGLYRESGALPDGDAPLLLQRMLWAERGLLPDGHPYGYARPRKTPPAWVLAAFGLPVPDRVSATRAVILPAPAFFFTNAQEGLGRITTNQVAQGLFALCTSPLEARQAARDYDPETADLVPGWGRTAGGYPRFLFRRNETRVAFILQPEVPTRAEEELRAMEALRDGLSDVDWEALVVLMERHHASGEGGPLLELHVGQFAQARQLAPKRTRTGARNGVQSNEAAAIGQSVERLAHVWVNPVGMTRKVRQGRLVGDEKWSLYHKLLSITGTASPEGETRTLAWQFRLGEWCADFASSPNRTIGYQWRRALLYHMRDQRYTKRLAYYFTFHLRQNARNVVLTRSIGDLVEGATIPCNPRYPEKARERVEDAIKTLVRDQYLRLQVGNEWLYGPSKKLDRWTAASTHWPGGPDLPARGYLDLYLARRLSFRADPVVEDCYEREVRSHLRAALSQGS